VSLIGDFVTSIKKVYVRSRPVESLRLRLRLRMELRPLAYAGNSPASLLGLSRY